MAGDHLDSVKGSSIWSNHLVIVYISLQRDNFKWKYWKCYFSSLCCCFTELKSSSGSILNYLIFFIHPILNIISYIYKISRLHMHIHIYLYECEWTYIFSFRFTLIWWNWYSFLQLSSPLPLPALFEHMCLPFVVE